MRIVSLGGLFGRFLVEWIDQIGLKLETWSQKSFETDKWLALDPSESSPILHSVSVVDVFSAINAAIEFLLKIRFDTEKHINYFFEKVVSEILLSYANKIKDSCLEDIANHEATVPVDCQELVAVVRLKNKNKNMLEISLTTALCVRINNIETIRTLTSDLVSEVAEKINSSQLEGRISRTFKSLKETLDQILDTVTTKMNKDIEAAINILVDTKKKGFFIFFFLLFFKKLLKKINPFEIN